MSGDAIPPISPRPPLPWEQTAEVSSTIHTERNTLSPSLLLAAMRSLQERRVLGVRFADILKALTPSCPRTSHTALRSQLMRLLRRAVIQNVVNRSVGGTYTLVRPTHISRNWANHIRKPPDARPDKDPNAHFNRESTSRDRPECCQRSTEPSRPSTRGRTQVQKVHRKLRLKRLNNRQPTRFKRRNVK